MDIWTRRELSDPKAPDKKTVKFESCVGWRWVFHPKTRLHWIEWQVLYPETLFQPNPCSALPPIVAWAYSSLLMVARERELTSMGGDFFQIYGDLIRSSEISAKSSEISVAPIQPLEPA